MACGVLSGDWLDYTEEVERLNKRLKGWIRGKDEGFNTLFLVYYYPIRGATLTVHEHRMEPSWTALQGNRECYSQDDENRMCCYFIKWVVVTV